MENKDIPAFPMLDPNGNYIQYGLTKLEYFAGLAMQGAISQIWDAPRADGANEVLARHSIDVAKELLKQLENEQKISN